MEDKIFAFTVVRLVPCIANVLTRSEYRHGQLARPHLHDWLIFLFRPVLLTRVIALALFLFEPSQNCFTYSLVC